MELMMAIPAIRSTYSRRLLDFGFYATSALSENSLYEGEHLNSISVPVLLRRQSKRRTTSQIDSGHTRRSLTPPGTRFFPLLIFFRGKCADEQRDLNHIRQ